MPALSASVQRKPRISQEVRDRIVLEHLPLVKAIAIRVHENLPVHVDLDDLIHAGVLGLFDAVAKYDAAKNVAFHAYSKHRIKGAILDSLRQLDWASRDLRKRQKQVESVSHALAAKFGRTPLEGEVAEEMGLSPDRWRRMQMELRRIDHERDRRTDGRQRKPCLPDPQNRFEKDGYGAAVGGHPLGGCVLRLPGPCRTC